MAISNDVQVNPRLGPTNNNVNDNTNYGCGTCNQPVTWDHRAVVCDTCDEWYNISCQDIQSRTYSLLQEDDNICRNCLKCNSPNYSTICYDLHHLPTYNMYSLSDTSIQNPDVCDTMMKPIHTSTPEKKISSKREVKIGLSPLRILNINCQSMKKKQDRMENLIDSTNPDIGIGTETWLDPRITNNQVFPHNYTVWRKDRENSKGGGVLIAVKNTFLSSDVPELQTTCDSCEIIWVKINVVNCKTLYICSYYNPSTSDEFSMINFSESINRAANMKDAFLLIGGDFNLPGWDWKTRTLRPNTKHPRNHYRLAEILDDNGLVQFIEEPTRNKNTLDLLITNIPSKILRTDIIPGISDHDIVYAEIYIKPVKHKQTPRKIPLYKKANGIV